MIHVVDKSNCCGCAACVQRCPKQCISLQEDVEGFLYPHVDESVCINCGLCEKVCPVLRQPETLRKPIMVYAAKNKNEEIRKASSSGGVFSALAEKVVREGGVVFGACFDDKWEVMHTHAETLEELKKFRGSKYVQSRIGNTFKEAEDFLKTGRKVLFSGTPCQIAGLKLFLRKEYANLLTVDIICHGVPSPGVWRKYLEEMLLKKKGDHIMQVDFRNKQSGWKNYSFVFSYLKAKKEYSYSECRTNNLYIKGFVSNLYLRPSCYSCSCKQLKSGSDLTLGDFWGIERIRPEIDDDRGLCCLLVNTRKGKLFIDTIQTLVCYDATYADAYKYNRTLVASAVMNDKRAKFYRNFVSNGVIRTISKLTRDPFMLRCKITLYSILVKLKFVR